MLTFNGITGFFFSFTKTPPPRSFAVQQDRNLRYTWQLTN